MAGSKTFQLAQLAAWYWNSEFGAYGHQVGLVKASGHVLALYLQQHLLDPLSFSPESRCLCAGFLPVALQSHKLQGYQELRYRATSSHPSRPLFRGWYPSADKLSGFRPFYEFLPSYGFRLCWSEFRFIPIGCLTFRAYSRPSICPRSPRMPTTFASKPCDNSLWHYFTPSFINFPVLYTYYRKKSSSHPLTNNLPCVIITVGKLIRGCKMEIWQERGLAIANSNTIRKNKLGWQVPSQSGNGSYTVNLDHGEPFCTCQYFEAEHKKCQHIYAVEFIVQKETKPDGTVTETKTIKITYSQDWSAYNEAQTEEKARFIQLLAELCKDIPQTEQSNGRPRLLLSDMVFASVFKVYTGFSSRRFTSDMREVYETGLVASTPHFNSVSNYLASPELTPLLKTLIEQSASPLKSVETDFAVDSSGFSTSTYARWFDHKLGQGAQPSELG